MQRKIMLLSLLVALLPLSSSFAAHQSNDLKGQVTETYATIVFANYQDSYTAALELDSAIDAFLAEPTEENFAAAQAAWRAAREPYGQTEAFRFYGGPIDDADGPEGLINAWPLDEVYIDYVEDTADAGIINNLDEVPEISAEVLEALNEQGAEENISIGYHAIEFLLWGQDLSDESAGQRPYTDYTTAPNADRRGQYLALVSDLLVAHLGSLVAAWNPEVEDNYRAEFLALEPDTAISNILTGIGVLSKSELAGERIFTAYDNQDQEDEHSCFSDNTHRDIILNAQGVANVYLGSYTRLDGTVVEGTALADLLAEADPALNEAIVAQIELVLSDTQALHVPFDQAIVLQESRPAVLDTVFALQDLGDMFVEAATTLGITINTSLPE